MNIFQRYFSAKCQGLKIPFYEKCCYHITVLFNDKGQLLHYNAGVYILVRLEKEHPLIWNAKPLTIQTGEGKSLKN